MFKAINFTRTNLNDLRADLNEVLERYGNQAGLDIKIGNISYSDHDATIKIEAKLPDASGNIVSAEEKAYNIYAKMDGINIPVNGFAKSPSLGKVRMVGYKTRNRKYPYIVEQVSSGKRYKMGTSSAMALSRV